MHVCACLLRRLQEQQQDRCLGEASAVSGRQQEHLAPWQRATLTSFNSKEEEVC